MTQPQTIAQALPLQAKTVGLFGTCGGSTWRDPVMAMLNKHGVPYFNPQVEEWTPECADAEAWHLANDQLILFPVTDETFGFGSLAETGYSIDSALFLNATRFVLIYIAPDVSAELKAASPREAEASRRARKLALTNLARSKNPNVFVVNSMAEMQEKTVKLYAALELLDSLRTPAANWRATLSPTTWLKIVNGEVLVEPQVLVAA